MGWVKTAKQSSKAIFQEVVKTMPTWNGRKGSSSSAYEYFSDYLRDNFDITIKQCDEVCRMLKEHYGIKKFYAND